jgi:hypothetical protein
MDEKKKILILAVLGVMVLGIGAFQFMPKGEAPAPEVKKEVPAFLAENEAAKAAAAEPPRNPMLASNLPARDPFLTPAERRDPQTTGPVVNKMPPLREPTRRSGFTRIGPAKIEELKMPGGLGGTLAAAVQKIEEKEEPFGYTIGGVVIGARPAVVFRDAASGLSCKVETWTEIRQ